MGEDPGRRALEEDHLPGRLLHDRQELDGRGAGADDGHPAPGQVVGVVPLRRVEGRPGEGRGARELGDGRLGQPAAAVDQEVGGQRPPRRLDAPDGAVGVPPGPLEGGVEGDLLQDPVLAGRRLQVALDLGLGGEGLGPARVGGEGEGVEVRGHVAAAAGVRVVVPGPADARAALQNDEVVAVPLVGEGDGRAQPREARADDGDPDVGRQGEERRGGPGLVRGVGLSRVGAQGQVTQHRGRFRHGP